MEPQMQEAAPGQPWIPETPDFEGATIVPFMEFDSPNGLSALDLSGDGMDEPYLPDFSQTIPGVANFDIAAAVSSTPSSGLDLSSDRPGDDWMGQYLVDSSDPEDLNNVAVDSFMQSSPVNGGEFFGAFTSPAMPYVPHDFAAEGFNIPVSDGSSSSSGGHATSLADSMAVPNDVQPIGIMGSGQVTAGSPEKIARRKSTPQPASSPKYGPGNPRPNNRVGQTRNWSQAMRQHRRRCEETVGCQEDCMVKKEFPEKWAKQRATVCKGWVDGDKEKGREVTTNELWAWKYDAKPARKAAPAKRRAKKAR
ncbi:hypothetical protein KC367_g676 [Hortaea werneckii]|nr:hypothetical protein KC350_g10559 [Hortaea werneckii]KAI6823319.1 hypothetical protein KC358_g8564 [Hortaea werneckii]KAI6910492.1 hypothetical protein KC348_g13191 [Hortaea werneckii]KAI6926281.1 hypothetical protein KC341_g12866 [Hortaea werneckii]KAI6960054.1 hypothetical protein KC321_g13062 [Hortaea werneckii]